MNYPALKSMAFAVLCSITFQAQAQIVGQSTDTNYYNTTIIYKKGEMKDTEILRNVENDFGMGDVIRIADAPPKPKVEPINKAPQRVATVSNLNKSNDTQAVKVAAPQVRVQTKAPALNVAVSPAKEEIKQTPAAYQSVRTVHTVSKSNSSVKKSRTSTTVRYKAPKKTKRHGKQRYSCPKF